MYGHGINHMTSLSKSLFMVEGDAIGSNDQWVGEGNLQNKRQFPWTQKGN